MTKKTETERVLYESFYTQDGHFSFGQNWLDYLQSLTPERVAIAQDSLVSFLGGEDALRDKTFLDIGSGSGLFSLAAYRLGAKEVVSVDIDRSSLAGTTFLKEKEGNPAHWRIVKASALDQTVLEGLGTFDIVYSWGVLHHTGNMDQAIENVTKRVAANGRLYISIYNRSLSLRHGTSSFWLAAKQYYNRSSRSVQRLMAGVYALYLCGGLLVSGVNPIRYIRSYQSARGMSWRHDIVDWLGGYPYEYASAEEVVQRLSSLGFVLCNSNLVQSIGCSEYLFVRAKPAQDLPHTTVLLSVHNSAATVARTLESVFEQTLSPQVVCVNDASTDATAAILREWQGKMGKRLRVVTNTANLGLTKSLNKGLSAISTPYTARIDADDWWEPTKLEKQINFLEANPDYGVVGCFYTNHSYHKKYVVSPPVTNETIRKRMLFQNPFAHSCVVFRTPLIRDMGGYDETVRYGQDYELWMRCWPKTKFFNLPEQLCHRSFTGGISIEKQHEQMKYAIQTRVKYIRQYRLPFLSYRSIIEPWIVRLTPRWLADAKRRLSDRGK